MSPKRRTLREPRSPHFSGTATYCAPRLRQSKIPPNHETFLPCSRGPVGRVPLSGERSPRRPVFGALAENPPESPRRRGAFASTRGRVRSQNSSLPRNDRRAQKPQSEILAVGSEKSLGEEHADRHRGHEEERFCSGSAEIGERGAGAEAAQAPAYAENCGADDEATVDWR